jgi:hypothetical protein
MKVLTHIQRSLLGLIFVVTGLNGFFRFLHQPPFTAAALSALAMMRSLTARKRSQDLNLFPLFSGGFAPEWM